MKRGSRRRPGVLRDVLRRLLADMGMRPRLLRQQALEEWSPAVGPEVAAHSRPLGWRGHALLVEVDEAVWAQQLSLLRPRLLAALNRRLEEAVVYDLRFVVRGRRLRPAAARPPGAPAPAPAPPRAHPAWVKRADMPADAELGRAMRRWLHGQLERHAREAERPGACSSCGATCEGSGPCPACIVEWRPGGVRARVLQLLREEPWVEEAAVRARIPGARSAVVREARGHLRREWREALAALQRRGRLRAEDRGYALDVGVRLACLRSGCPPATLQNREVAAALGPLAGILRE